jgi:hypothetical protein
VDCSEDCAQQIVLLLLQDLNPAWLSGILGLRLFLRIDRRRVVQLLWDWSDPRQVLGLRRLAHHSTLCHAGLLRGEERSSTKARRCLATGPSCVQMNRYPCCLISKQP